MLRTPLGVVVPLRRPFFFRCNLCCAHARDEDVQSPPLLVELLREGVLSLASSTATSGPGSSPAARMAETMMPSLSSASLVHAPLLPSGVPPQAPASTTSPDAPACHASCAWSSTLISRLRVATSCVSDSEESSCEVFDPVAPLSMLPTSLALEPPTDIVAGADPERDFTSSSFFASHNTRSISKSSSSDLPGNVGAVAGGDPCREALRLRGFLGVGADATLAPRAEERLLCDCLGEGSPAAVRSSRALSGAAGGDAIFVDARLRPATPSRALRGPSSLSDDCDSAKDLPSEAERGCGRRGPDGGPAAGGRGSDG